MTVIAAIKKDNSIEMWADHQASWGDLPTYEVDKIVKNDRMLLAIAGKTFNTGLVESYESENNVPVNRLEALGWWAKFYKEYDISTRNSKMIGFLFNGVDLFLTQDEGLMLLEGQEPLAVGSGDVPFLAAYYSNGGDASAAIEMACKFDIACGLKNGTPPTGKSMKYLEEVSGA